MHVDERQAAVAYTYAWWMSGEEDAAAAALRSALHTEGAPDAAAGGAQIALVRAVRDALGDAPGMYPASQVALLHDGLGLPLDAAADIAGVTPDDTTIALANGRLEALLETVRDPFEHPERLGGLAIGDDGEVSHARGCPSCARARTLIDRGRAELQAVAPVSAPPGLLASLVAEVAPPPTEAPSESAPADAGAQDADAAPTISVHEIIDAPQDYAVAGDDVADVGADEIVLDEPAPAEAEPEVVIDLEPAVVPEAPPEALPEKPAAPSGPGGLRAALAGAGLVTLAVLVGVWVAQSDEDPGASPSVAPPVANNDDPTEPPAPRPTPTQTFGPRPGQQREFAVLDAGLLRSGETEIAPSGGEISPTESIRIAVDYANATRGVRLDAVWRVDDEPFERLSTVVSGRRSRHVWGLPLPEDGWPAGSHRIVLTADDSVAGAVDFTVPEG